ncbi:MAG: hypothetical protein H6828_11950 [Planctomycetes bacterium]|nr:hypothetical protein [Planctomycetota bacterium]
MSNASAMIKEEHLLVDDVVAALTEPIDGAREPGGLRAQMERAAEEFDRRTAEAFGKALVDSLCEDPGDVRRLEALLILGLAHPHILGMYKVSLAAEGRRLCVLLENRGEEERARGLMELLAQHAPEDRGIQQELASMMRRCGEVDELIARCLARADEEVKKGRPMDAIPWLQEILLHDQSRRDVARMIRDLRYQEIETTQRRSRLTRGAVFVLVLAAAIFGVVARERGISSRYAALPSAGESDVGAMRARLTGLDELIDGNKVWLGMMNAVGERSDLRQRIDKLEAEQAERDRKLEQLAYQRQAMAEAARLKALDLVNRAEYEGALFQFQRALELSAPDWERRERISANVVAIQELLDQRK